MTGRATRQLSNPIFLDQLLAQGDLIDRGLVIHIEHVLARSHITLRGAVTLEAPIHIERIFPPRERHRVDSAVTGGATNALVDMNAMIEINKTGKVVDSGPLNRLAGAKTLAHRLQHRTIRPDLTMTIHAGLGRRNTRERTLLYRSVAIAAVDAIVADVMFVAKRHRLATRHTDFRDVGRLINGRQRQHQDDDESRRRQKW